MLASVLALAGVAAAAARDGAVAPRGVILPPASRAANELSAALGRLEALAGQPASASALARAYEDFAARDLLLRREFERTGRELERLGLGGEVWARHEAAVAAYTRLSDLLHESLGAPAGELRRAERDTRGAEADAARRRAAASLERAAPVVRAALAEIPRGEPAFVPLRAANLPYRRGSLTARPPRLAPAVTPSYLDPLAAEPGIAELTADSQTPLSEPILRKAAELGHDPARIYEFVRNEIAGELYAGAMKGAEGTLARASGNDVDQASLLIALLRASQIPARYVRGAIELPLERIAEDLGLASSAEVPAMLGRLGLAFRPVIRGGRVVAVEIEHTWVSAFVPYSNYRGAVVDVSGKSWVPLAPAFERFQVEPSTAVLRAMDDDIGARIDAYLSAVQTEDPLALLRRDVEAYLQGEDAGPYAEQLGRRTVVPERLKLLPSSLPVVVTAITAESPVLPGEEIEWVRLVVREGAGESSPVALEARLPLAELVAKRVTLSYTPATVEDDRAVNAFGGFYAVPLYLVRVRPQIKIAGRLEAVGTGALDMGAVHRFELEISGPAGTQRVAQTVLAGSYHALALGAQEDGGPSETAEGSADDPADSERTAARLLSRLAHGYAERWGAAEDELGGLLDVAVLRPLPSVVVASNSIAVETLLGLPYSFTWKGVTLDAALRAAEPVARRSDAEAARDWMRLAALEGSSLEQLLFRADFQVDAVSADKGLALARQAGIEIVELTSANLAAELPALAHPPAVKAELDNWVRQGLTAEIPRTTIQRNAWSGSVWRIEEPATGAAGYFIAGSLAGGATSEPPESWVLDFLARALASPYSAEPNSDPLSVATLRKLPAGDFQEGVVGEEYDNALAVLALDAEGRPVLGARVSFAILRGGGALDGGGTAVTALTNQLGIAQVRLRAGERTADNPVFVLQRPGDRWASQALQQLVEVAAESASGTVLVEAPFEAVAFPGPIAALIRTEPNPPLQIGFQGLQSSNVWVQVRDAFDNSIANVNVTFSVGEPTFLCLEPPMSFQNAAVFDHEDCPYEAPRLGECGGPSVVRATAANGIGAGVLFGSSTSTLYVVRATAGGLPPVEASFREVGECNNRPRLLVATSYFGDEEGRNIQAARGGEQFRRPIPIRLQYEWPTYEIRSAPDTGLCFVHFLPNREWRSTTGNVEVVVADGGSATAAVYNGVLYETFITPGPVPAVYFPELFATDINREEPAVNPDTCEEFVRRFKSPRNVFLYGVFGLELGVTAISPPEIQLNDTGQSVEPLTLQYAIAPDNYRALTVEIELYENDVLIGRAVGTSRSGIGTAEVPRGLRFDVNKEYEAQVVTSRGTVAEVRSDRFRLPLVQSIFAGVSRSVTLSQDVDILNERACSVADVFRFDTTQDATITLAFRKIETLNIDGTSNLGPEIVLINGVQFPGGSHGQLITPRDLLPGDYVFELRGVSTADGHTDIATGKATSQFLTRDSLPVGHAMYKGVDLFDGHLAIVREDFALGGRGVPLRFVRSYSSAGDKRPGSLGVGWGHNWDSRVVVDKCGEVIVVGGEGGGMRFVDDGAGGLRPLKGFHGTLRANASDNSFDFYSKDGTRWHYVFGGGREWLLEFVEDANGNRTTLSYDRTGGQPKLVSVADAAGRTLSFSWTRRIFTLFATDVITRVEGPGGIELELEYNDLGNLIRASREGGIRVDEYGYPDPLTAPIETRALITRVRDGVSGANTDYTYDRIVIGVQGEIKVPSYVVTSMSEPAGGSTTFTYDTAALDSRAPATLTSTVLDRRGGTTTYALDRYGSPLAITDPAGNTVAMTWAADDVLMTSRTDGNGARTDFDYDEHGNLTRERLTVHDFDGTARTLSILQTWHPPAAFVNQASKDRLASRTDRNGVRTEYSYDGRGNLTRMTVVGQGHTESYAVAGNGDRLARIDANGRTSTFAYDSHGYPSRETDPLGGVTTQSWDVRGRLISKTDAEGRTTRYGYDNLNRLTATDYPDGARETVTFNDAVREIVTSDALGRITTKSHDLEMRLVRTVDALGNSKEMSHDPEGGVLGESNWFGNGTARADTTFTLDGLGRPLTRNQPEGRTTAYLYDGVGNVVRETLSGPGLAAARVTERGFDELGREHTFRRLLAAGEITVKRRFDGQGNVLEEINPLGFTALRTYDGLGRMLTHRDPLGGVTTNTYDAAGNQLSERDPLGRVRSKDYDALNRLVRKIDALGQATIYEYDRVGNLVREVDRRLHDTRSAYDARNRLVRAEITVNLGTAPAGLVRTTHAYDAAGNRISTTHPNGRVETQTHDARSRVLSISDQIGTVSTRAYDANGNVVSETDANGNITTRVFDGLDRLLSERAPEGRTVSFSYDAAGNRITQTDARGHLVRFEYDAADRLVRTTDDASLGTHSETTYDLAGKPVAERDRNGNVTTFSRDALGRVLTLTDPPSLGTSMTYTYDAVGNLRSEADRRGLLSTHTYDAENRRLSTTRAGVTTRRYEYDPNGNVRFETDANNIITGYEYDERNLRVAQNKPLAAITRYRLDAMGDRIEERDPENRVTVTTFDLRRRRTSETDPAGNVTRYTVDGNGNVLTVRRPSGATWTRAYDGANRLLSITDPLSQVTSYTYDAADNRETMTDGRGKTTRAEFDALNRQTATVLADGARIELGRDGNGNIVSRLDAKGQSATYGYDALNRERLATFSPPIPPTGDDLVSRAQTHDGNGNVLTVTEVFDGGSGTRTTTHAYDDFERIVSVTDPAGEVVRTSYDAAGNRTQLRDSDGRLTTYAYDALNRVTTVTVPLSGVTQYSYLRNGLLSKIVHPNGTEARTTYDAANRVGRIDNLQSGATVSSYVYTYDANSNRAQQIETNGGPAETTTYAYDALDRLVGVTYPDKTAVYTYDAASNRLTELETSGGGATLVSRSYTYDDRNRLLAVTDALDAAQSITFGYDANGSQISRVQNGVATAFAYDGSDRLVEVQRDGLLLGRYLYNHEGLRVRKAGSGAVRRYVYDDRNVLLTTDDAGNTISRFEYGPDRLLSMVHATEGRQFYLFDGLRSIVDLTRPDGTVQARYRYDAWGNSRSTTGTSFNLFGFTGYERDDESGLHYAKARYYDSTLGRFLSQDPAPVDALDSFTLNPYTYSRVNPTRFVDPSGLYAEDGHYYTTYYVALKVGYTPKQARVLAFYSQAPDEVRELDAIAVAVGHGAEVSRNLAAAYAEQRAGGSIPGFEVDYRREQESEGQRNFVQRVLHALTGGASGPETESTAQAVKDARGDLRQMGLLTHRLADTFAHRRAGWLAVFGITSDDLDQDLYDTGHGHLFGGHTPDLIQRRPELYLRYVEKLAETFAQARGVTDPAEIQRLKEETRAELADVTRLPTTRPRRVPTRFGFVTVQDSLSDEDIESSSVAALRAKLEREDLSRRRRGAEGLDLSYRPEDQHEPGTIREVIEAATSSGQSPVQGISEKDVLEGYERVSNRFGSKLSGGMKPRSMVLEESNDGGVRARQENKRPTPPARVPAPTEAEPSPFQGSP